MMRRSRGIGRAAAALALSLAMLAVCSPVRADALEPVPAAAEDASVMVQRWAAQVVGEVLDWYGRTPAGERVAWGGLAACVILGLCVTLERVVGLRVRAVIPKDFTARFLDRLHEGKLDGGKALDYCEMNPSPAARVALAAVRRWGRSAIEVERAVGLAHRWESERLRRNVGTLRRVALLAPLLGFWGTLLIVSRLAGEAGAAPLAGSDWVEALRPLIFGVGVGAVAVVAFDLATTRVEKLGAALDRLGAETIDAIAMTTSAPRASFPPAPHARIDVGRPDQRAGAPNLFPGRK